MHMPMGRGIAQSARPVRLSSAHASCIMAHGADMVVESRNMYDDVLFTPELVVLMPPTICSLRPREGVQLKITSASGA